jgi:4-diphosphocytidyl-2-C-methyl-D-erythritol kinase
VSDAATTVLAPAKVNLVLRVGPRRPDGYHGLVTLLARVDLADVLLVSEADRTFVDCPALPGGDTLVTRALLLLAEATGHPRGFHVHIDKRIPHGAGLGGGSADAAAALRHANDLVERPLPPAELDRLAAEIGSDVPALLRDGPVVARGRGERVEPFPALPACGIALAHPGRVLATRDVYARYRPADAPLPASIAPPADLDALAALVANDLQAPAEELEPRCAELRVALLERGALAAAVSGSGSAVFGLFPARQDAERAIANLPGAAWAQAATLGTTSGA